VWISARRLQNTLTSSTSHLSKTRSSDLARIWDKVIPAFGSFAGGLQVNDAALGGRSQLNPRGREIGNRPQHLSPTDAGRQHSMFVWTSWRGRCLCAFTEDEVVRTEPGIPGRLLASNAMSRVLQAP